MTVDVMVIQGLATDEAALRGRLASSEAEVRAWRELALATLDALHDVIDARTRLDAVAAERLPHAPPLVDAIIAAKSLREVAMQAIHYAATVTQQHDRLRASHYRLLDERRHRGPEAA